MQHLVNYNSPQDRSSYNNSPSNENLYDRRRSSSSGATRNNRNGGSRPPQSTMNAHTSSPSTSGIPVINGGIKSPSSTNPSQRNNQGTQVVYTDRNDVRTSQQYQQPPRPTSASQSRLNPPTSHSPSSAGLSNIQSPQLNGQARAGPRPTHAQIQSPKQRESLPAYASSQPTNTQSGIDNPQGKQGMASNRHSVVSTSTQPYDRQNTLQQEDNQQPNSLGAPFQSAMNGRDQVRATPTAIDSAHVQPTISAYNQVPFTVNPSQVFNQDEYQRRQAAAAAEANGAKHTSNAKSSAVIAIDPKEGKKMELEMKQMIRVMRDYKAKDPSLFSQVWEQVKKETPPIRSSSQPTVQEVSHPERSAGLGASSAISGNHQLPSPSPTHNQLPLESELEIIDSSSNKPDFDRGKFPAQRRRRGGSKTSSRKSASITKDSSETPVPSKARDPSSTAASETMQEAMDSHHENLDPRLLSHRTSTKARTQVQTQARPEVVCVSSVGPSPVTTDMVASSLPNGENGIRTAPVANMMPVNNEHQADAGNTATNVNNIDPSSRGTIWPEAHKWKLAAAATTALTSSPANAGKQLSADAIHQILNRNPSYTELCETLEARGFIIERGHFARTLLAAVPDFGSTRSQEQFQTPPSSSVTPSCSNFAQKPPTFGMLVPPESTSLNTLSTPNRPTAKSQSAVHAIPTNYQRIRWADQNNVTSSVDHPQTPHHDFQTLLQPLIPSLAPPSAPPCLPSKEEMARKRSFSDIVDLTQGLSEDDDIQPPSKVLRVDHQRTENPTPSCVPSNNEPEIEASNLDAELGLSASAKKGIDLSRYNYVPTSATALGPLTVLGPLPTSSKRDHLRFANVVRPMNRNDALRRSSYNPKTICRDILVSSGKHPTMAPLNYHLDGLRKNFDDVDSNADLSTFRWDLVDPGGNPGPCVSESKPAALEDVDVNDADDEDVEPTAVAQPVSRRGRRRVNVATAVDGEGVAVPEVDVDVVQGIKGSISRRGRKPRRNRDSGIHSVPIDVDASPSLGVNIVSEDQDLSRQNAGVGASTNYAHMGSNEADQVVSTGSASSPPRGRLPAQTISSTPVANTVGTPSPPDAGSGGSEPKRRGRPPGSKDKSLRKNAAIRKSGDMSIRTRPRSSLMDTTPARPSALRQTMTPTDGIAVVIESPSKAKAEKTRNDEKKRNVDLGRPTKRRKASPKSRQPSSPNHQVYKCQWQKCPAKLHNLETLRKHIRLHREAYPVGPFPCLWSGCGTGKAQDDDPRQPLEFESETGWDRHMEGRHLDRYAWELGDGPSTHPSGTPSGPLPTQTPSTSYRILTIHRHRPLRLRLRFSRPPSHPHRCCIRGAAGPVAGAVHEKGCEGLSQGAGEPDGRTEGKRGEEGAEGGEGWW